MDHILFIRAAVDLAPNTEEVAAVKYVTRAELAAMMALDSGLAWSPWFRIIASEFLDGWWRELDVALTEGGKFVDAATVHRLHAAPAAVPA